VSPAPVVVIGGGLVGLATAWRLLERAPGRPVLVLEKEDAVGRHQSGHNSGVLHAGLYYTPGSAKARLAVEGIREMVAFCQRHAVPHEICGKLVVAADASEVPRLEALHARGRQNGLTGLAMLTREEALAIEPHVGGVAWLRVPEEGIVDYPAVAQALAREITARGGRVRVGAPVVGIARSGGGWRVTLAGGEVVEAAFLVGCAGLHADRVSALAGEPREARIVPFRGEYWTLAPDRTDLVRHLIYPVPDPRFPFLGVHFTRMIGGGVECGPNAVLALAREGYRWRDIAPADVFDALTYGGLWRFLARYPAMTAQELWRSASRAAFAASLQRLVPSLRSTDLSPGGAGVRAQAMTPDGTLVQDFHLVARPGALHVLNAPSPAATASLSIGRAIVEMIAEPLALPRAAA
jgi:L-2-hydroxyglutarate oxidase